MSSTSSTRSPASKTPSRRFAVPYSLACPAHDHERAPVAQRERGHERHRAELGPGQPSARGSTRARLARRAPRRAARAAPDRSRTGTCRGRRTSACPSAARNRRAAARARRAGARARRASPAGAGDRERLVGERQQPLGLGSAAARATASSRRRSRDRRGSRCRPRRLRRITEPAAEPTARVTAVKSLRRAIETLPRPVAGVPPADGAASREPSATVRRHVRRS